MGINFLSSYEAEAILEGERKISLDLGVTIREYRIRRIGRFFDVEGILLAVDDLKKATKRRGRVYKIVDGNPARLEHVAIREEHFYQLVQPGRWLPTTLEIDGIHMHKIVGTDPLTDARRKVEAVDVQERDRVWDTCTGLGYTALEAARRGARVVSTEIDEKVLELARINPWSRGLFERVDVRNVDALLFVKDQEDEAFDVIVHDPPRFALAGELYSLDFYRELYRVLRPGGRLYHYVGRPGEKSGKNILKGVMDRLRAAGFEVKRHVETEGVVATKPSGKI